MSQPQIRLTNISRRLLVLIWLISNPLAVYSSESEQSIKYDACLRLAETNPIKGYKKGLEWYAANGGLAARHCMAVSIFFGGDNLNGASRLEALERDIPKENIFLRSQILAQAGQAWLMAGLADRSSQLLNKAINLNPENPELYLDRATISIEQFKYIQALKDLDQAITLDPSLGDAYLYRAYVKRDSKDIAGALTDINRVLELLPGLPVAVLERGFLKELIGDENGARKDWEIIIQQAPKSEESKAARIKIISLDEKHSRDRTEKSVNISNGSALEK